MIRHVVIFNLKPDLDNAEREWIFGQIQAISRIPAVKRFFFGKLLEPREGWYKPRLTTEYSWSLSMEFDNEDDLYAYQMDSFHVSVAQEIRKRVSSIKVMDFVSASPQ